MTKFRLYTDAGSFLVAGRREAAQEFDRVAGAGKWCELWEFRGARCAKIAEFDA